MGVRKDIPKGWRKDRPLLFKGETLIEETKNIDGEPALIIWSNKEGHYILREWDDFNGWGDRAYRTQAECWRFMHGPLKTETNMARARKNAAAGAERVVNAFIAGRKAKEGSRSEYKPGVARYETDGQRLIQWGNLIARKVNGSIQITDAGWRSKTTMAILNYVLRQTAANAHIYQKSHQWFLSTPGGVKPWNGSATVSLSDSTVLGNSKKEMELHLGSSPMIYAPGLIRWIKHGFATSKGKQREMFATLIHGTWKGVPPKVGRAMAAGTYPYEVKGETVIVKVHGGGRMKCNPLTRKEVADLVRSARGWIRTGKMTKGRDQAYFKGRVEGIAETIRKYGASWPSERVAGKIILRSRPLSFNPLSVGEAKRLLHRAGRTYGISKRYEKSDPSHALYLKGVSRGRVRAAHEYGPKKTQKMAERMGSRLSHAMGLPNPLSCFKNLHTKAEQVRAKRLIDSYYTKGKAALHAGKIPVAAHCYGAIAAIRQIARGERPMPQTVVNVASFRLDLLKRLRKDLARMRGGSR